MPQSRSSSSALEAWDLKRTVLVADGELAMHALTAVKLARQEETVVAGKPRYDSKSKGACGECAQVVRGLLRTWVASLEKPYHTTLGASSPLVQRGVQ